MFWPPPAAKPTTNRDPEHVLEHRGIDITRSATCRRPHVELLVCLQVVESPDAGRRPGVAGTKIAGDAADPGDLGEPEPLLVGINEELRDGTGIECREPSVGAPLSRYWMALRLAAPGMFWTMMPGVPGRWRPMWRARTVVAAAG